MQRQTLIRITGGQQSEMISLSVVLTGTTNYSTIIKFLDDRYPHAQGMLLDACNTPSGNPSYIKCNDIQHQALDTTDYKDWSYDTAFLSMTEGKPGVIYRLLRAIDIYGKSVDVIERLKPISRMATVFRLLSAAKDVTSPEFLAVGWLATKCDYKSKPRIIVYTPAGSWKELQLSSGYLMLTKMEESPPVNPIVGDAIVGLLSSIGWRKDIRNRGLVVQQLKTRHDIDRYHYVVADRKEKV